MTVVRTDITVNAGAVTAGYANCPSGQRATGGGVGALSGGNATDRVVQSGPVNSAGGLFSATVSGSVPVSWYGKYYNGSGSSETAYIWAICAA